MTSSLSLGEIRAHWNDVLDYIEKLDRIAWISFFDARLAKFDGNTLTLDFSDARKFSGSHEYAPIRQKHRELLQSAIWDVFHIRVEIAEQ